MTISSRVSVIMVLAALAALAALAEAKLEKNPELSASRESRPSAMRIAV